jgi:hypothetical protein
LDFPVDAMPVPLGETVIVAASASSPAGMVTAVQFFVEGKWVATGTESPFEYVWDTSGTGPGTVGVQARALDSAGSATLSRRINVEITTDADADGLPDDWEYQYSGSHTGLAPGVDIDGDGLDALSEYVADTVPTNVADVLSIQAFGQTAGSATSLLSFVSSSNRLYEVQQNPAFGPGSVWDPAGATFRGAGGNMAWSGSWTNEAMFLRVRPMLP